MDNPHVKFIYMSNVSVSIANIDARYRKQVLKFGANEMKQIHEEGHPNTLSCLADRICHLINSNATDLDMDALKKDSQSDEEEKKDDDSPAKTLAEAYRQDPQYNYLKQLALETPIKFRHMANHVSRQSTGLSPLLSTL